MSEVQSTRAGNSRGRGGFRGGRGGYRGGRNPSRTHKDNEQENMPPTTLADEGEVGELKRKFGDQIPLLREVCPGWSDEDLVFALEETNGDLEAAVDRISSGTISQWGEVKKKQPKSKDSSTSADTGSVRGRGRGGLDGRGRGRGAERGARGGRGARAVSQANGAKPASKPEDDGWGQPAATTSATGGWDTPAATNEAVGGWDSAPTNGDAAVQAEPVKEAAVPDTTKSASATTAAPTKKPGGWASLFAKPPPAPKAAPIPIPAAQPQEAPTVTATAPAAEEPAQLEVLPPPIEEQVVEDAPSELPSAPHSEGPSDLPPGKDDLTETNLEQLPDESHPPASQTAASTTASTQDPLAQQPGVAKAPIRPASGYAATALKATTGGGRSASFARKVKEQQEAVVMPGNHAVEKAAVQFGKMGLNGEGDDLDEDREEAETRTQLPDDSPVAPRASLPPALPEGQPTAAAPIQPQIPTEPQAQRQAPGLPPAPQQAQQVAPQVAPGFGDQYRYGQVQKPYDPFGQPPTTQAPPANQEPFASQVPGQPQTAGQPDMSAYYSREAYQQYYGYGQHQDAQRAGSAFGTSAQDVPSQYATARPQQGYAQQEATTSGNNTPAPGMPAQASQSSQHPQQQHMGGAHGAYPYGYANTYGQQYPQYGQNYMNQMTHRYGANRPMFDDARRSQQQEEYYGNQYAYGSNQHYGGGGSYKSGMYGQPHQQYSHEYSSSPANAASFGGRENAYGRSGSTQPGDQQQMPANSHAFGGMPDPFGRSSSGFGQAQSLGQQHGSHQGSEDATKVSGPSPSVQAGRPGSAVNTSQAQQAGLGQGATHNSQQAFGGYPQYGGGFGNFGGQQGAHQTSGYGTYGTNAFGTYGGYGGGRGWNH